MKHCVLVLIVFSCGNVQSHYYDVLRRLFRMWWQRLRRRKALSAENEKKTALRDLFEQAGIPPEQAAKLTHSILELFR